jgi:hypothetical protein
MEKGIVRQVGYLQSLYRDTQTKDHKSCERKLCAGDKRVWHKEF